MGKTILPLLFLLAMATSCFADSLVITYRSGHVQTVQLDEPVGTITGTEYRSPAPFTPPPAPDAKAAPPSAEPKVEQKQNQPPGKPAVKFKWAPPRSE
jgi:hypothetical protein